MKRPPPLPALRLLPGIRLLLLPLSFAGCSPEPEQAQSSVREASPVVDQSAAWSSRPIGAEFEGRPWLTHVNAIDLDGDGLEDVLATEGQADIVIWLRQLPSGEFEENVIARNLPAPVHVEAADLDGDGDLDLLVACMGMVFPNNDRIGSVVILENEGGGQFRARTVLENVARVTDVRACDFNGDGQLDLAVAQFGYNEGEVRWMENLGDWQFRSHLLLSLPGAINVCVADVTGNGHPDIVTLVSQQHEEIHLFEGQGNGSFSRKVIFGSTNEDFGSSGIRLFDLNGDGRLDVLYTNGDGFDYAEPGSRPWHGVQWLENRGNGMFHYHRIGDLPGAYSPVGGDFDGDGRMDVVAVSGFNSWDRPDAVSLMLFRNEGGMRFAPQILAREPTHLISVTAIRIGEPGRLAVVTAGFHAYPPYDRMSRLTLWEESE